MLPITTGQFTISDLNDTIVSSTEPSNPIDGTMWLDTSTIPNVLKVYHAGTGWVKVTPTTPGEVGAVDPENIIATINASGENVQIQAAKIYLDGYVEAKHIKSLNGLNVNDQLVVDSNGNVTISGTLSGASGTFSGTISSKYIYLENPTYTTDGWVKMRLDRGTIDEGTGGFRKTGWIEFSSEYNQLVVRGVDNGSEFGTQVGLYVEGGGVEADSFSAPKYQIDAGGSIDSMYSIAPILKDHNNGNVTVSAAGNDLYLGYYNTNYIQAQKELRMNAGGRVTSGALVVANGNVDASNGIVLGGAFKFTKTSAPPTSGDGVLWYGNGYNGLGLYMYKTSGWVQVK